MISHSYYENFFPSFVWYRDLQSLYKIASSVINYHWEEFFCNIHFHILILLYVTFIIPVWLSYIKFFSELIFHDRIYVNIEYQLVNRVDIYWYHNSRDRIVVSTLRCGRSNPGSNPGHGSVFALYRQWWFFYCKS